MDVLKHAFDFFDTPDFIVLLQTTSPLRSVETINKAIRTFIDNSKEYDSLMPVMKSDFKLGQIKENLYIPDNYGEIQRQELKHRFFECGTIFIYKKEMMKKDNIYGKRIYPFLLESKIEALEIDSIEDLHIIKCIMKSS
jgi:N-acylneuraminate cytidylyltransferase/CMP-N,N'-diacetyllegionaminic acid synthase